MSNKIIELLEVVRNKGGCSYTQNKAEDAMLELKGLLPIKEYRNLSIALSHFKLGEGAGELYDQVKKIKLLYS